MNIESIENLNSADIMSLYDEIIEAPELISPHWCCYGDKGLVMDWDYSMYSNDRTAFAYSPIPGQRMFESNLQPTDAYTLSTYYRQPFNVLIYSDGWGYTNYLCNAYCHRSCDWQYHSC